MKIIDKKENEDKYVPSIVDCLLFFLCSTFFDIAF